MRTTPSTRSPILEVFSAFLLLGLTSFGGPIAHLGYFRTEFVERRRWLSEQAYADLVALCQFLPGPSSSQVGFALGLMRAGPWGGVAAWLAFTLPSALLLLLFAYGATQLNSPLSQGLMHGLKITAVAIVAHAIWSMARTLCPDPARAAIALTTVFIVVLMAGPLGQVSAIVIGALTGLILKQKTTPQQNVNLPLDISRQSAWLAGLLFFILLLGLPTLVWLYPTDLSKVLDAFYRSGALVFGGGHVVLPLLEAEVVQTGWVSPDQFLAGYSATQVVPGPLFTFAAYLGAVMVPLEHRLLGATLALVFIFLPGILLVIAVLPYWNQFRQWPPAQGLIQGANAAVVGILGAALYDPIWVSAIYNPYDFVLALSGFLLLSVWRLPAWAVVILLGLGGMLISL